MHSLPCYDCGTEGHMFDLFLILVLADVAAFALQLINAKVYMCGIHIQEHGHLQFLPTVKDIIYSRFKATCLIELHKVSEPSYTTLGTLTGVRKDSATKRALALSWYMLDWPMGICTDNLRRASSLIFPYPPPP